MGQGPPKSLRRQATETVGDGTTTGPGGGLKEGLHSPMNPGKPRARKTLVGIRVSEQSSMMDRADLPVSDELALRCKHGIESMLSSQPVDTREKSATLDAKAVDVKTGRAI